jgi:hypothetical protein
MRGMMEHSSMRAPIAPKIPYQPSLPYQKSEVATAWG